MSPAKVWDVDRHIVLSYTDDSEKGYHHTLIISYVKKNHLYEYSVYYFLWDWMNTW